jgi:hypothetical protein
VGDAGTPGAVPVSDRPDWSARARREAAAIIAEAEPTAHLRPTSDYDRLVTLLAACWIQGANYGAHEGIEAMGEAFRELKADLA